MTKEFKVGDKVKITGRVGGAPEKITHGFNVGSVGEVIPCDHFAVYANHGPRFNVKVKQDGVMTQYVSVENLELVGCAGLDLTSSVFTAEGTPVTIITTTNTRDKKFPVLAYEGKAGLPSKYTLEGISKSGVKRRNLTNTVPAPEATVKRTKVEREFFVNLYDVSNIVGQKLHSTADAADKAYYNAGHNPRVGVAKLVLVEGRFPLIALKGGKQ